MVVWTIFVILYAVLVLLSLRYVFYNVSNPSRALSWILVLLFLPFLGVILFRLMGRNVKKDRFFQRNKPFYNRQPTVLHKELLPKNKLSLVRLLSSNNSAALSYNNNVEVLKNGTSSFNYLREDIQKAKRTIHLDFYIVESGNLLNSYLKIFKQKIKEGITIRLVYDAFGTVDEYKSSFLELGKIGVEVREFMPFNWLSNFRQLNYRNHRKIAIIDSHIAYTGGMNISDKHIDGDPKLGLWRDTFVRVEGEAAIDLERIFLSDWCHTKGSEFNIPKFKLPYSTSITPVQIVTSGPDSFYKGILQEYFFIITKAENYVYISTPYFIPGEEIITALKTSALSGVDVQLMMPYDSDSKWLRWCMFTYLEELLAAGVKIFLYHSGFLHNKVFISDDIISSVGTANIDTRSFDNNFEVNAIVYDSITCNRLKQHFEEDKIHCELLKYESFGARPDRNRFAESLARLTSPML